MKKHEFNEHNTDGFTKHNNRSNEDVSRNCMHARLSLNNISYLFQNDEELSSINTTLYSSPIVSCILATHYRKLT